MLMCHAALEEPEAVQDHGQGQGQGQVIMKAGQLTDNSEHLDMLHSSGRS